MRPDPPAAPAITPTAPNRSPVLSSREISTPPSPATAAPQAPTVRPKLNLAKRTISEADPNGKVPKSSPAGDSKASPFGSATPIDTATREKEVEEKRQAALREKKEADDKAREEKKIARETEKTEKAAASKEKASSQETEKENGGGSSQAGKNFEILRRKPTDENDTTDEGTVAGGENGIVVDDKSVKPKEIVRDISPKTEAGTWANGDSPQVGALADSTAEALEEDGWSTVSKARNNRRNGNQAARAIAS